MKHIKGISDLTDRTLRNGESHWRRDRRKPGGSDTYVYRATYDKDTDTFKLYHYGTLILTITDAKSLNPEPTMGTGAYSVSDRQAINTALYEFNLHVESGGRYNASITDYELNLHEEGSEESYA